MANGDDGYGVHYIRLAVDNTRRVTADRSKKQRLENANIMRETVVPVSDPQDGFPAYRVYKDISDALVESGALKFNGRAVSYYPACHVGYALAAIEQSYGEGLALCSLDPEDAAQVLADFGQKDTGIAAILNAGMAEATKSRIYRQDAFTGRL